MDLMWLAMASTGTEVFVCTKAGEARCLAEQDPDALFVTVKAGQWNAYTENTQTGAELLRSLGAKGSQSKRFPQGIRSVFR